MRPVDLLDDRVLVGVVLLAVGEDLLDERVEVGVGAQRAARDELLAARRALLVAGAQRRHDAVVAEPRRGKGREEIV